MRASVTVRNVRFRPASQADAAAGLLGWVSFEFADQLRVDGVAIRRTNSDGRLCLSYPAPRGRRGRRRRVVWPLDDRARREIEAQVLAALAARYGIEEWTS